MRGAGDAEWGGGAKCSGAVTLENVILDHIKLLQF